MKEVKGRWSSAAAYLDDVLLVRVAVEWEAEEGRVWEVDEPDARFVWADLQLQNDALDEGEHHWETSVLNAARGVKDEHEVDYSGTVCTSNIEKNHDKMHST